MSILCWIGIHRWSFSTDVCDEPEHCVRTELVSARCRREGCARYGAWSLVHQEAHFAGSSSYTSQRRAA